MTRFAPFLIVSLASFPAWSGEPCRTVEGGRILARDMAAILSQFSAVPPETPIAYAPTPGSSRIFRFPELQRLAARFGVPLGEVTEVCFELPMETLTEDRLSQAMRAVPEFRDARIEVIDYSRFPVPRGQIEFKRAGLATGSDTKAGIVWKGQVLYAENRNVGIWVKARISMALKRVVAVETLKADQPVAATQVRLEEYEGLPSAQPLARELEQVVGLRPRRAISAGTEILLSLLAQPNVVARGETVDVEVRSGSAKLGLTGRAESSGAPGDTILVRNTRSGKSFPALVSAKGKVLVVASKDPTGGSR